MKMSVRAWSWTRIDGRNVLAVPTQTEIRLYDSDDFILLSRLAPSGHRSPVAFVRWSAFHGKLASLSCDQILVHAPQRDPKERSSVHFAIVCCFKLDTSHCNVRGLAFSRSADELLFCGRDTGVGKLDIRQNQTLILWESDTEGCDVAKYSPSAFVFATLKMKDKEVKVWRMKRKLGESDQNQTLSKVEILSHPDLVVYFSWKPSTARWHSALETDGTRKAQWFEPARILLTCTATRSVRIWTEREEDEVEFIQVLVFEPTYPIDNVRWVMSKNRNISDENFQVVNDVQDNHADWISGVDQSGILRLWRLVGIVSKNPTVEETTLQIKVNGEDDNKKDGARGVRLGEACVMAYFSQNYFGMPSKLGIVLQRADHIMMSFHVAVGEGDRPSQILKKSWYRSHVGSISALSAHPSLPLIASVDAHLSESDGTWRNEILVYWISFSAFSAESRLIPSGVLPCEKDCGEVLCILWVPTLHFDATPLLLVAFASGVIDVYGRSVGADVAVVSSPRVQLPPKHRKLTRSPSLSPWTFYDYVTGESGYEYEVTCEKPTSSELEIQLEEKRGKLLVSRNNSTNTYLSEVVEGDELVGINNKSVVGKDVKEVLALIDLIPPEESLLMRFRAACVQNYQGSMGQPVYETVPQSTTPAPFNQPSLSKSNGGGVDTSEHTVEEYASVLRQSFLSSLEKQNPRSPRSMENVVHAGAVSMYGGWKQLLHMKAAPKLSLLCVCPAYADDGEYVPDSVLIFGIESLPGKLCVWKGVREGAYHSFELVPLQIQDQAIAKKTNITSIAGERDYRQRAFSSKRVQGRNSLNSLLFIGDAGGNIEHWRCQTVEDIIHFTMMSSHPVCSTMSPPSPNGHQAREPSGSFCRRGYVSPDQVDSSRQSEDADAVADGISHIEVDDPNRLAVLHVDRPEELHVFEAESGLGILRLEESIPSNGRGHILGFTWCNSHVEFNVDALAVRYESATVIYQYDTNQHRWSQVGDDIVNPHPLFDCTRDSSALLIGGGHLKDSRQDQPAFQPISNEMPVVVGKWDEPGSLLQYSMDWKAVESPQKLPVWHPYVLLTTMFGMHARVGKKDTLLAGDRASYEFSRAFKDATQMLKLLAKVMDDEPSARASAASGVLSYTGAARSKSVAAIENGSGRARMLESVGRYSTSIHRSDQIDKAENLFAAPMSRDSNRRYNYAKDASLSDEDDQRTLASTEATTILTAIDSMLLGKTYSSQPNASVLFASFSEENLLEMKALLSFVDEIQSLGFDLDASAADLGAKRFFSMYLFAKSLRSVVLAHTGSSGDGSSNPQNGDSDPLSGKSKWRNSYSERESCYWLPSLEETPSSGLLWALHSDAQQFLWEHCIQPEMQWDDIRPLWLGLWIKDVKDLRGIVGRFAKVSYARTKDAMDVCLLYVALGKKKVLSALAKLTQSESNKTLASFLENDFSEKRWSNAAIKNAYSLLSKKNYEVAAAFFLLCEPPRTQDAIRVLSVRLGDPSLALIIARLVEYQTDDKLQHDYTTNQAGITPAGEITKQLLEQEVIPLFRRKGEVWLESCALWWLEEFEQAWAVLLPQFQDVDVCGGNEAVLPTNNNLVSSVMRATHFYVNLTSLTVFFQHLHSSVNSSLLSWAKKKMQQKAYPDIPVSPVHTSSGKIRLQLASTADIEHAFSFAAYVCKRSGLSDTALVEMLQARHLVNVHARFEISTIEAESDPMSELMLEAELSGASESPTSPRFQSSLKSWRRSTLSSITSPIASNSPRQRKWSMSPRRMSFMGELSLPHIDPLVTSRKSRIHRASSISWSKAMQAEKAIPTAPWLKAQIADIECRRWASSAFVGKMIGIRVAREMISHFRAELDMWFRHGDGVDSPTHSMTFSTSPGQRHHHRVKLHREFLDELCTPLCEQFQVDRNYVYEAALAVMHPHAYLHIVEVCFLLSELGRVSTLRKWVEYVSLSMLHSCSTFASCSIAEDVYRDWEGLTIQLCYILNLDAQGQINIPAQVIAQISVAVRTGIIFLGWARQRSDIVRQAVTLPFYTYGTVNVEITGDARPSLSSFAFEKNLRLLCRLLQRPTTSTSEMRKTRIFEGNLGYTFLGAVAARQTSDDTISLLSWGGIENASSQNQFKIRKMYTLILMVSVLRTLYARATVFLSTYQQGIDADDEGVIETDIASSLFTPKKLWKALGEGPLEGLKRWYALIESHLRCEFDYSVKEVPCLCGLYGLDTAAFEEAAAATREGKEQNCQVDHGDNVKAPITNGGGNGNATVYPAVELKMDAVTATVPVESDDAIEDDSPDSLQAFLHEIGMSFELHKALVNASDDYVLLLMRNETFGVRATLRRFRIDPRVYVKSFVLRDAFSWFARHGIFSGETESDTIAQTHAFLSRCCKQRKLRLLVAHRGEDVQMFPLDHHHARPHHNSEADANCVTNEHELALPQSRLPGAAGSITSDVPTSRSRLSSAALRSEPSEHLSEAFYLQSMMFVDPWEVEAEWNVRRYMHSGHSPLHVELGWDRLSPICLETCDGIVDSAFEDPDLITMWKATGGEGWLVTAITQYRLDGLHSYRTLHQHIQRGLAGKEEPRIPLLVEIYSRSQRNAMFEEAGLPHRFIGVITVELVEAKDLIACSWVGKWSNAYVFLELSHTIDKPRETAGEWRLHTYRSPVGEGGVNPHWDPEENNFVFRFAIPTHGKHTTHPTRGVQFSNGEGGVRKVDAQSSRMASQLWNADINDQNRDAVNALEKLLPSVFSGPPAVLRCTVYQKNKVLSHQFMGRTKVSLNKLTSSNPMDCWMPLEDTTSGSLHVKISLSFQLMCSTMAGQPDSEDVR